MRFTVKNIAKRNSLFILILVLGLLTPLLVVSFSKSFDGRSRANIEKLPDKFRVADLDGNNKVDAEDFTVWVGHFTKFLKQSSYYNKLADLDGDKKIGISDFEKWLSLFNEYQVWVSSNNSGTTPSTGGTNNGGNTTDVKVTALSSSKYLHIISVGEFIMPNIFVTPSSATSNDLVYRVDKPNIVKLVDDTKNPHKPTKLMVGLSEGDARIIVSSKHDPSVRIIFFLHIVKRRALSLSLGENYTLNGYGVTKWKELGAPGNINLSETGAVTGKKRGVALVAGFNGDKEVVRVYIGVDLLAKPTYSLIQAKRDGILRQGYMLKDTSGNRKVADTNKAYSSYQKVFLEDYLTQKVEAVGGFGTRGGRNYQTLTGSKQGSRAGAVEAARFLALEFPYRIPYGNTDYLKKVYKKGSATERFDLGSWYNYADYMRSLELNYLYGYKINIHDANDNNTGKGCWGCATGVDDYLYNYTQGMFGGAYQKAYVKYHGLHCGTFVGWAMYNGGLNYMAGAQSLKMRILGEPEGYLPYKQPGAEYLHLFDKDNKVLNVTEEQWKKVMVGDLIYRTGHIGMIIGIDHKNKYMYVAHQTPDSIIVDRVNYMRPQNPKDFVGLPWQKIILMDNVYEKGGYISSMW